MEELLTTSTMEFSSKMLRDKAVANVKAILDPRHKYLMQEQRTAALKALGELKACFDRAEAQPDENLEEMVACDEEVA